MAGSLERAELRRSEADDIAVADRKVRKHGAGLGADHDLRSGSSGELAMPANEIGVQVGLDHVLDAKAFARCFVNVLIDIALRIDNRRLAAVSDQIRSVREAAEVELLEEHIRLPFAIRRKPLAVAEHNG
jgi:hypothetical protein